MLAALPRPPFAGKPKTLEELFAPLSQGACVTIDAVRTVGVTTQLSSFSSRARFGWQFLRRPRSYRPATKRS
jgi:hypothetical protein